MRLALPIGLLGLSALIALILIYVLKPKFQQREVSSTLIWKLSLKYQKRKIPFEWLNSLVLILQIFAFTLAALMLAQPFIPANAQIPSEKVIILEASGSMLAEDNGTTRFDRAKNEIIAYCTQAIKTHLVSVVLADKNADDFVIYRSDNEADITMLVGALECGYGEPDINGAMSLAYSVLDKNPDAQIILYSSREYNKMSGVEIKNMSLNEWNAAILDFSVAKVNNYYEFTATVASYNKDDDIDVTLSIDGVIKETIQAKCRFDEEQIIKFTATFKEYSEAQITIDKDDSFIYDNTFSLFAPAETKFLVQYASNSPHIFFEAALIALQNRRDVLFDTVEGLDEAKYSGYDLYIFEGLNPDTLPTDGAILFVNPPASVAHQGLIMGAEQRGSYNLATAAITAHNDVLNNLSVNTLTVSKYRLIEAYSGFDVLLTVDSSPALLIKNEFNTKIAILAFSLNYSNLGASFQFPTLIFNLFDYFLPSAIDSLVFDAGIDISLKSRPSVSLIGLSAHDLTAIYTQFPQMIELNVNGNYILTQTFVTQNLNYIKFFVRIPRSQSDFNLDGGFLPVNNHENNTDDAINTGTMLLIYFAAALFALLLLEWWLQYREQ